MKKEKILLILILSILVTMGFVSASLSVTKETVYDTVIKELDKPAVYKFTIQNLASEDTFEIFTLLGVDFSPKTFTVGNDEVKTIEINAIPSDGFKKKMNNAIVFDYFIRGKNSGEFGDKMMINVVSLKDAFSINGESVTPGATSIKVKLINIVNTRFDNAKFVLSSSFFDTTEKTLSFDPYETQEIIIPINKEKVLGLYAGDYTLTGDITISGVTQRLEGGIKYLEKSGLSTTDESSGFINRKRVIEKVNEGNIPSVAEITVSKNIISRLYSAVSPNPTRVDRKGFFSVDYYWQKELKPGDKLEVVVLSNMLFPLLLIFVIVVIAFVTLFVSTKDLLIKKKVNFVKAKGGAFALKVTLIVSARRYIENVRIFDKLPSLVKLYPHFGVTKPDKIDEKSGRISWEIKSLDVGEKRIFSYIIYSKIGVVGNFELPAATGVFEKDNKIHEVRSNRAFFVNEIRGEEKVSKF